MSYRVEKGTNDLVISGFEQGIASSPHKGIANIQSANISTEEGEVMASFNRIAQLQSGNTSGTLTPVTNSTVSFSPSLPVGSWFTITVDSGTGLSGSYYYLGSGQISQTYNGAPITNILTNPFTTIYLTSGTSWTVPANWNSAYNTIETIGAGGDGAGGGGTNTGSGGGAGAYSKVSNLTLTPGAGITYAIGTHGYPGTDTYFNGASIGASSVGAKGGGGGSNSGAGTNAGGVGGQSSSGVGTTKFSGGNGGSAVGASAPAGAGGGSAGPNGIGGNGSASTGTLTGGTGDLGSGGVGGTGGTSPTNGANGTEYDGTHGAGGGGGAGNNGVSAVNGGNGGLYGAGGGGTSFTGGSTPGIGAQGLIKITYSPINPVTTSATYSIRNFGSPIQSATEIYYDTSNNVQYRYYILDSLGDIWVHDSAVTTPVWASIITTLPSNMVSPPSGLSVLNGWISYALNFATNQFLFWISTSMLGTTFNSIQPLLSNTFHATLVGHQGKMYYTDGNYIGSMFPSTSLLTGKVNVQSYCSYTASTTTGTITAVIGGSVPYIDGTTRLPVVFFTNGTLPATITAGTIYYVVTISGSNRQFNAYTASSGGSPLDIQTGAVGPQFFNTFYPVSSGGQVTLTFTNQALNLPFYETAQCLAELGNTVVIGGNGNVLYPWDQISTLPGDLIPLAENNTVNMITANNMLYVFTGQKGNIYICNGSSASLAISVPDYCAGISGTKNSYIEPYFSWGGAMFMRGRVWFSILDQTSVKAGNCGGIWSFIPTNNLYIGQDTGQALRLENQSSYGTYSGVSPVLIASLNQKGIAPQYWSAWYSSISNPTYGIDFTDTVPCVQTLIETDLMNVGTMLNNKTLEQIEYKLSVPLVAGESIGINYRQNATDSYQSCGTVKVESVTELSGYFTANFQNSQWLQLQIALNPVQSSTSSFCRLKEVRAR